MALTKEEALAFLTPERKAFIWNCIRGGLNDYDNSAYYSPEARRDHTTGVRATLRNCHTVGRATRAAISSPDLQVRIANKRGRLLFVIADELNVSFKKLNKDLRASRGHTHQALSFLDQQLPEQQLAMKLDVKPITNVIAGYRSDLADAEFEIYLTCPDGDFNKWEIKLTEAEVRAFVAEAEAASATEVKATTEDLPRRVRLRKDVAEMKDGAGGLA